MAEKTINQLEVDDEIYVFHDADAHKKMDDIVSKLDAIGIKTTEDSLFKMNTDLSCVETTASGRKIETSYDENGNATQTITETDGTVEYCKIEFTEDGYSIEVM